MCWHYPQSVRLQKHTSQLLTNELLDTIPAAILAFQSDKGVWITPNCQLIKLGQYFYYGILKGNQFQSRENYRLSVLYTRELYQTIKSIVLQNLGLSPDTKVIQVVGDSAAYTLEGTKAAKAFLHTHLT